MGSRKSAPPPQASQAQISEADTLYQQAYNDYKKSNEHFYTERGYARNADEEAQFESNAKAVAANAVADFEAKQKAPKAAIQPVKSEAVKQMETLKGIETPEDIASREKSTLANPKKQRVRGRRSLISAGAIGSGVTASREQLG